MYKLKCSQPCCPFRKTSKGSKLTQQRNKTITRRWSVCNRLRDRLLITISARCSCRTSLPCLESFRWITITPIIIRGWGRLRTHCLSQNVWVMSGTHVVGAGHKHILYRTVQYSRPICLWSRITTFITKTLDRPKQTNEETKKTQKDYDCTLQCVKSSHCTRK